MTNERQAEKIMKRWGAFADVAYNAATDMAEWKDEQYRKLLDKLVANGADKKIIDKFLKQNDISYE